MRVYRLYSLKGLQLRMKVRRRKRKMLDGRKFCTLTVIDQRSRESVMLEANYRLSGRSVAQALDQAAGQRGWPQAITVENGTEFTSKALDDWAYRRGVKLDYTRPGKLTDNGLIESFNGRLRDEFLNVNEFVTMPDMHEKMNAWQDDYNHCRPHSSLGHLTSSELPQSGQDNPKKWPTSGSNPSGFRENVTPQNPGRFTVSVKVG